MAGGSKYVIRYSRKGAVLVTTAQGGPPVITLANGKTITGERADKHGGLFANSGESDTGGLTQYQWVLPDLPPGVEFTIEHAGQKSGPVSITAAQEVRADSGGLSALKPAPNKAANQIGAGPGGAGGGGPFGAVPKYLGDKFPSPQMNPDRPIPLPAYNETSIKKFGQDIGNFNREQIGQNTQVAKETALDTLDTELQGLQQFVPGAAKVQRGEVFKDNTFNQLERNRAIDSTLPNLKGDIEGQRKRALSYASGKSPDSVIDAALELGVRSNAADLASAGGFGVNSSASRKASDLMSADKRLQLAAYGEGLLSQNEQQAASLLLAPTSYATAGQQISAMPSISGSQLQQAEQNRLDTRTVLDPGQALSTQIQQQQFKTNLIQDTNKYNSTLLTQNGQYNTDNVNNFALSKFNYEVSYANSVAAGAQIDINTGLSLQQQEIATNLASDAKKETQLANAAKDKAANKNNSTINTINTVGSLVETAVGAYILYGLL